MSIPSIEPPPIYLLVSGETTGPFKWNDIYYRLDRKELPAETLSAIEGMPGWRSIPETLTWAEATLLTPLKRPLRKLVAKAKNACFDNRLGFKEIVAITEDAGIEITYETIRTFLSANTLCIAQHFQYHVQVDRPNLICLADYPALELYMLGEQKFPRDWKAAWVDAGGKLYYGRMVARRDDPVWSKLNDFGFPFPPFGFDTAPWTEMISTADAEYLGVVDTGVPIQPPQPTRKFDLVGIISKK